MYSYNHCSSSTNYHIYWQSTGEYQSYILIYYWRVKSQTRYCMNIIISSVYQSLIVNILTILNPYEIRIVLFFILSLKGNKLQFMSSGNDDPMSGDTIWVGFLLLYVFICLSPGYGLFIVVTRWWSSGEFYQLFIVIFCLHFVLSLICFYYNNNMIS